MTTINIIVSLARALIWDIPAFIGAIWEWCKTNEVDWGSIWIVKGGRVKDGHYPSPWLYRLDGNGWYRCSQYPPGAREIVVPEYKITTSLALAERNGEFFFWGDIVHCGRENIFHNARKIKSMMGKNGMTRGHMNYNDSPTFCLLRHGRRNKKKGEPSTEMICISS